MNRRWIIVAPIVVLSVGLISVIGVATGQRRARTEAKAKLSAALEQSDTLKDQIDAYRKQLHGLRLASLIGEEPSQGVDAHPELIDQLQAKDDEIASLRAQLEERRSRREVGPPVPFQDRRQQWQERLERLREEDPEEYQRRQEEFQQRQEERRQRRERMEQRSVDQVNFMAAVPTNGLASVYLTNHVSLLERLQLLNEARATIEEAGPDDEARRELFREMREQTRGLREMFEIEKELLLMDFASGLGLQDQGLIDFVEYVDTIEDMTSPPFGGWRGRGGRGGRGGPGTSADPGR